MPSFSIGELRSSFEDAYAPNCLKIKPKGGGALIPFRLKPMQREVAAAIRRLRDSGRPPRILNLKARQLGFSTFWQGFYFHDCHLNQNRNALVLAHKAESAAELFQKSRVFYQNLPDVLRPKKRIDNRKEIRFSHNNSLLKVEVAAEGGGRGYTAEDVHLSEFAHMADPESVLSAIMDTVPADPRTCIAIETTANGVGNTFHNMWVAAKKGRSDWLALFFPWFREMTYRAFANFGLRDLDDEEKELVRLYDLTLEQLAWRRNKIKNDYNGDTSIFLQEHPSDDKTCFLASGRPAFDRGLPAYADDIEEGTARPPLFIGEIEEREGKPHLVPGGNGRLRLYAMPIFRHQYVGGIDAASGDPGTQADPSDDAAIAMLDRHTLDLDAVWWGKTPPDQLAHYSMLLGRLYNMALLCPESNNHGLIVVDRLDGRYENLYFRRVARDDARKRDSGRIGWQTTVGNRHFLINQGRQYVREHAGRIDDPNLIEQMQTMRYVGDKAEVPDGCNDDLIFAFCLAIIGHKDGDPDAPLAPLPVEQLNSALERYREAMLLGDDPSKIPDVVALGLTPDDLQRIDEEAAARREREQQSIFYGEV